MGARILKVLALALSVAAASTAASAATTLEAVKSRGYLQCGVNTGVAGFSMPDSQGNYKGLDVDLCRGIAAAVLGDNTRVKYTPLTAQ
jgi:general L-amino acid transport system substrate-binding protein